MWKNTYTKFPKSCQINNVLNIFGGPRISFEEHTPTQKPVPKNLKFHISKAKLYHFYASLKGILAMGCDYRKVQIVGVLPGTKCYARELGWTPCEWNALIFFLLINKNWVSKPGHLRLISHTIFAQQNS